VSHVTADHVAALKTITRLRPNRSAKNPANRLAIAYTHRNAEVSSPNCDADIGMSAMIDGPIVVSIVRGR
jgi:hypothetical protein